MAVVGQDVHQQRVLYDRGEYRVGRILDVNNLAERPARIVDKMRVVINF